MAKRRKTLPKEMRPLLEAGDMEAHSRHWRLTMQGEFMMWQSWISTRNTYGKADQLLDGI